MQNQSKIAKKETRIFIAITKTNLAKVQTYKLCIAKKETVLLKFVILVILAIIVALSF